MIQITTDNNHLIVKFDYNSQIVNKIKTIPYRRYNPNDKSWELPLQAIHDLKNMFNENELDIAENVNQNYKNKKYSFNEELANIENLSLRTFAQWSLQQLPDYFYQVPASSTGKYHPTYALGDGGLVRHTRAGIKIAEELFNCNTICNFTNQEKDIIRISLLLHDGVKHGLKGSYFTTFEHPLEIIDYLEKEYKEKLENNINIPSEVIQVMSGELWTSIKQCIKSHMGQWNTNKKSKTILPLPKTDMEKFVHLCDYLASRKILEVNFQI